MMKKTMSYLLSMTDAKTHHVGSAGRTKGTVHLIKKEDVHLQKEITKKEDVHLQKEITKKEDVHLQKEIIKKEDVHLQKEIIKKEDVHLQKEMDPMCQRFHRL